MSVFAHVVLGGSIQSEPAATQALAFILNSQAEIARAFLRMLGEAGVEFEHGLITAEEEHENSRPDLTIRDSEGRMRVFVENKFWAGLTDAQPVSYLRDLPEDLPSALVFVVPEQRVRTVWNELEGRCHRAELAWANGPGSGSVLAARVDRKTMLITSWKFLLEGLRDAAHSGGHETVRQDIVQLQNLTSRMDSEAFLPLRVEELTSQETARRLINYSDLIDDIVGKLKSDGVADTKGLKPTNGYYTAGRYLRVHGRFGMWFGVRLKEWREHGGTPLWLEIGNAGFSGAKGQIKTVREIFLDAKLDENKMLLYIPILLENDVERDTVVDAAAARIEQIADKLRENFPATEP